MCGSVPVVGFSLFHQKHHLPSDDKHGFSVCIYYNIGQRTLQGEEAPEYNWFRMYLTDLKVLILKPLKGGHPFLKDWPKVSVILNATQYHTHNPCTRCF